MPLRRPIGLGSALVLALLSLGLSSPASAAEVWPVDGDATITVDGHGFGHGRGLSQYGAEHAATLGVGYREIVDYYYPGTDWGTADGQVRVYLTAGDIHNATTVDARSGLRAEKVDGHQSWVLAKKRRTATRWRIRPQGDTVSVLQYRTRGWHTLRKVDGSLEFIAGGAPIALHGNDGATREYRGVLRSVPSSTGNRITVNVLSMETYLRGVVPAETLWWKWHQATLEAQAVAARSYAANQRIARAAKVFDVDDTAAYQVYAGASGERANTDAAVRSTAGQILTYDGGPAFTEFSASSGGWTTAGDEPYLVAMEDQWAASDDKWLDWQVPFTDTELERAWPQIGDLTGLRVDDRDGHGEWGGRVGSVTLTGDQGTTTVSGPAFAATLHLASPWLTLTVGPPD